MDVYEQFKQELLETVYITEETADDVVKFLDNLGILDFDHLKEIYLYPEED